MNQEPVSYLAYLSILQDGGHTEIQLPLKHIGDFQISNVPSYIIGYINIHQRKDNTLYISIKVSFDSLHLFIYIQEWVGLFGGFNILILCYIQLSRDHISLITAWKIINNIMTAVQSDIFWCFIKWLSKVNNTKVLVLALNEIIHKRLLFSGRRKNIESWSEYLYTLMS